ncbi:MAG: hypothetical protein DMG53_06390 [Acidobacteria bacterium]|nr:MAG: hypothetical protein DMG53_06390 [Acidobacteriota bacterium]
MTISIKHHLHESTTGALPVLDSGGAIFQPTIQPTKCGVLYDFRVVWQSPRSIKVEVKKKHISFG